MKFVLQPWQILLLVLAGWINKHQQDVLEYLLAENRILREKLGKKRILLNHRHTGNNPALAPDPGSRQMELQQTAQEIGPPNH